MNSNGEQIIEAISRRLKDEDSLCTDANIVNKLRELDRYEISQLSTFGEVDKWMSERNDKLKELVR